MVPAEDSIRQQLLIQWQDHFQTRDQTWKALQIVAASLLALIGADFKLQNRRALFLLGGVVIIASFFGIVVTIHHRMVQTQKFRFIFNMEEKLGLHAEGLITGILPPEEFRLSSLFNLKHLANPAYMLIMHILILIFVVLYMWLRQATLIT